MLYCFIIHLALLKDAAYELTFVSSEKSNEEVKMKVEVNGPFICLNEFKVEETAFQFN
jgi:hypothetical protein